MAQLSKGTLGTPQLNKFEKMPIKSSFIQFAEYDEQGMRLTVTFTNGAERTHMFVYPQVWQQFLESQSKGRAYNQLIKDKSPSVPVLDKRVGRKQPNGIISKKGRA